MQPPPLTRPELEARAARAGLTLAPHEAEELVAIHPLIRKLADRVRPGPHPAPPRGREAEPAHIFRP